MVLDVADLVAEDRLDLVGSEALDQEVGQHDVRAASGPCR